MTPHRDERTDHPLEDDRGGPQIASRRTLRIGVNRLGELAVLEADISIVLT
jgi:hypothetical protein